MKAISFAFSSAVLIGSLNAASLITPVGLTNTSGVSEFFAAGNMINNSGLSGAADIGNYTTITHAGAGGTTAWTTDDVPPAGGDYYAQGGTLPVFTLDFDQVYAFTDLVFWGYHFGAANGNEVNAFTVEFSADNGGSFPTSTTVGQPLGDYAVSNAVTLSLGGSFNADTIRISFTDNHFGGPAAGGDRAGLGELKFIGDAVPEPSSGLLTGLASLMLLRRRR